MLSEKKKQLRAAVKLGSVAFVVALSNLLFQVPMFKELGEVPNDPINIGKYALAGDCGDGNVVQCIQLGCNRTEANQK